jgi:hypothetical protein
MPEQALLTEAALLAAVGTRESAVDGRRLRRWREKKVVPPPQRVVTGSVGSGYRYPTWVVDQVVRVAELLRERRDLDFVAIELWWEGRWIDCDRLRAALIQPFEAVRDRTDAISDEHGGDALDAAQAFAAEAERDAANHGGWGLVGQRIGARPEERMRVTAALMQIGFGEMPALDVHDDGEPALRELMLRALGFERLMHEAVIDGEPLVPDDFDLEAEIIELAGVLPLRPQAVIDLLAEASDDQLEDARRRAHIVVDELAVQAAEIEQRYGSDYAALGSLRELTDRSRRGGTSALIAILLATRRLIEPH